MLTNVIITVVSLFGFAKGDIVFTLDPGSTITPTGGVAEALTGTFIWRNAGPSGSLIDEIYDATSLNLSSPSFTIMLNVTSENNRASVLRSDNTTRFGEVVDGTGFTVAVLDMSTTLTSGTFEGTNLSPSKLFYNEIMLFPAGGGLFLARIEFTASAVPEPSSVVLVATIFAGLWKWRKRNARASNQAISQGAGEQSVRR